MEDTFNYYKNSFFNFCPPSTTDVFPMLIFWLSSKGDSSLLFFSPEKALKIPIVSLIWMLSTNA